MLGSAGNNVWFPRSYDQIRQNYPRKYFTGIGPIFRRSYVCRSNSAGFSLFFLVVTWLNQFKFIIYPTHLIVSIIIYTIIYNLNMPIS